MDNNKKRNLDAVSRIDEKVLEKQTKRRIELLSAIKKGFGKKRWIITIGSAAASLALIFTTVFLLINLLGKTVPVYTGMTVSGAPGDSTTLQLEEAYVPSYADPGDDNGLHKGHYKGDCKDDHTPPADEPFQTPIENTLSVIGTEKERYYAKPYEDIYITVHIDNPDSFEILSFTLNGEKYSSYMFEQGSDLENLILKVNVGNAEGVVDYTIDAIKYVDGEKIKDVKMEGDQTVEVGIYTEKQPVTTVTSEQIGFNSVSFSVSTEDAMGLVGDSAGKLEAVIYDGEQIVAKKEIAITGASEVRFDGLETNKVYQYAVLATYDALDGAGMNTYVLLKKSFSTRPVVLFDSITLSTTGVQFALSWDGDAAAKSLTALTLYQGDSKLRDLATDAVSVDGLRANTAYVLIADYQNGGKTEQIKLEFTTDPLVYTVNYLLENLAGDGYEQIATSSTVVEQDAVFAPALNSYEGFTSPTAVQKIARADDDSFVVNYQYTRNTYMLTLKNSGTSDSQLLKYGAPLEAVSKPDFDFVGWFNANGAKITHMPASALTVFATWAGEATANDLYFNITETDLKITVTGLKNRDLTELHIPAYLSGMPVVGIGARAFLDQTRLVKVTVPDTVTAIGEAAFSGCAALQAITVPFVGDCIKTADELHQYPFGYIFGTDAYIGGTETAQTYLADSLTSAVTSTYYIPTTLTTVTVTGGNILRGAFYGCGTLTAVKLPDSCTEIGSSAFWDCQALQSCTLPTKLQKIDYMAFTRCYSLSSISLPATLKNIGQYSFSACRTLQAIDLPSGLQSIGNAAFSGCIALETLHIPASVSSIGTPLFVDCVALEQLTVASENTHFRMANGCLVDIAAKKIIGALKNATIPTDDSVTVIGTGVFQVASWLTELTIPANIEEIQNTAFSNCTALRTLQFAPNSTLKVIGNSVFNGCDLLSEISVPDTVTSIGQGAFHCKGLTAISLPFVGAKPVTAPDANQYPLGYIFNGASSTIPEGFVKVSQSYHTNETSVSTRHYLFPAGLKTVSVGGTYLPYGAFYGCTMLESITLTGEVTDIGANAFFNCKGITTISLPTSLKTLSNNVFRNCEKLEALTIPAGVTSIGTNILNGCTSLETLTIPFVGDSVKTATDEKQYPFGYLFGSTSDITGTQAVRQYYISTGTTVANTTYYIPTTLKSVTVTGGNILQGAFYGCTMLESVTLPQALTEIGDKAFCNCTALDSVNLSGIAAIGINAFQNCTALDSVDLSGITTIGANAFQNCTALSAITLPATLTSMGANAFYGCSGLSAIDYNVPALTLANGLSPFRACGTETEGFTAHIGANVIAIPAGLFNGGNASTAVKLKSVVFADNATCQSIGGGAFQYCTALESVTLPEGLTSIGGGAFQYCTALESVTLPEGLTALGHQAFGNCTELTTVYFNAADLASCSSSVQPFVNAGSTTTGLTLHIAKSVTQIPAYLFYQNAALCAITFANDATCTAINTGAFAHCTALESILLPQNVERIGDNAFACCANLNSISLSKKLVSIETYAFGSCTALTDIALPQSLQNIGSNAFAGCSSLTTVHITDLAAWCNISFCDGISNPLYLAKQLYLNDTEIAGEIVLPDTVKAIPSYAFYYCDLITSISIPSGAANIGSYAFAYCSGLETIDFAADAQLASIGEYAFINCTELATICIPTDVISIGTSVFSGCENLSNITLPFVGATLNGTRNTNFTYVFGELFPALNTVIITGGASVDDKAFENCIYLKNITLPQGLVSIGEYAFHGCKALTSITLPEELTSIGEHAFYECEALTSITLPRDLKTIGYRAFYSCTALTKIDLNATQMNDLSSLNYIFYGAGYNASGITVNIAANVTKIPAHLFSFYQSVNSKITTVLFASESACTSIGEHAFYGCNNLTSITLPEHLTSIEKEAFRESRLSNITIPANVTTIGYGAFHDCSVLKTVTFAENSRLATIEHFAFYNCKMLSAISLPEGLLNIGASAFSGCTALSSVSIPSSVTNVGASAFQGINAAAFTTFQNGKYLGNAENPYLVLAGVTSTSIISFTIPEQTKCITTAFAECKQLTSITIPAGVTAIAGYAFQNCTQLASVIFAEGSQLTKIGGNAFERCTSLTSIIIPANVTTIDIYVFNNCSALTSVAFAEGSQLKSINAYAFQRCEALASIIIPETVTSIGYSSFSLCNMLRTVYYGGTVAQWTNVEGTSAIPTLATVYFYSATEPTDEGNYWHEDTDFDGIPEIWGA